MVGGSLWNIGLVSASVLSFASACLMILLWNLELLYFMPIAFAISFLIGFLIIDVKRSVLYTYVSMILGKILATTVFLAPYVIYQESVAATNYAAVVVLSVMAKLFVTTVIVYFLGAMFGCFIGEKVAE